MVETLRILVALVRRKIGEFYSNSGRIFGTPFMNNYENCHTDFNLNGNPKSDNGSRVGLKTSKL